MRVVIRVGLAMLVMATAACGGSSSSGTATSPAAGGQPLSLEAKDFAFNPTTITVTAGKPVTLTLQDTGAVHHNFTVDDNTAVDKPVNLDVEAGKTATVTFTPTKSGQMAFHCEYHGASKGMKGTMTVNPGS
jgi:plastocyanin